MANCIFCFWAHLRAGYLETFWTKDWVIAKSLISDWGMENPTIESSFLNPAALDRWVERTDMHGNRGALRAFPPRMVHMLAGNSPTGCISSIAQGALVKAVNVFKMPSSDPFTCVAMLRTMAQEKKLEGHLATYTRNRELLLEALPKMGLGRIAPPDGAFYIYADVSRFSEDSFEFVRSLLRATGVCLVPGKDFSVASPERYVRVSYATSLERLEEAVKRMRGYLG